MPLDYFSFLKAENPLRFLKNLHFKQIIKFDVKACLIFIHNSYLFQIYIRYKDIFYNCVEKMPRQTLSRNAAEVISDSDIADIGFQRDLLNHKLHKVCKLKPCRRKFSKRIYSDLYEFNINVSDASMYECW